ncbi:MAG: imidazolonepropionase [Bdellovibrionaceae bacterium]|nr:imidazolonepropionase [Pseudobdellovibrionaceae bacterium]NUM58555.1 imidazolonepropionase [Pseudobdellovibrionaceae bacterium]
MILLKDAKEILSLQGAALKKGRGIKNEDLSVLKNHSLIVDKEKICWIGELKKLPSDFKKKIKKEISLKNKVLMPTLIECHTHTVFAGSRSAEFEMRLQGASYQEISANGGGILSTQKAIDLISKAQLLNLTQKRVNQFVKQGVSVVEIKSGYGLDLKNEIKSLEILKQIENALVIPTFLGAHAVPKSFSSEQEYLNFLKLKVLPEVKKKKLSQRVDIFIEKGFFSKDVAREYLKHCQSLGFEITIHADQISLSGGSELACELGALSADHVIQLSEKEIKKISQSEVTPVLLPLADLYMRCAYPPARKLIDSGARVALASDFNPGTCPSQDVMMVGLLARLEMKMTLTEVIVAYTLGASYALNLQDQLGSIEVGKKALIAILEGDASDLFYSSTQNPISERFFQNKVQKLNSAEF